MRYSFCSRSAFLAALLYLDDISNPSLTRSPLPLNSLTIHRLLVTAVLLATKSFDDVLYDNAHFAKVGGLDTAELNALELDFLARRGFRLHISRERFYAHEARLVAEALASRAPAERNLRYSLWRAGFAGERVEEVQPVKRDPGSPGSVMSVDVFQDADDGEEERERVPEPARRRSFGAAWRSR